MVKTADITEGVDQAINGLKEHFKEHLDEVDCLVIAASTESDEPAVVIASSTSPLRGAYIMEIGRNILEMEIRREADEEVVN